MTDNVEHVLVSRDYYDVRISIVCTDLDDGYYTCQYHLQGPAQPNL